MVKMTSIDLTIDFNTFVEALRLVIEDSSDIILCKIVPLKLISSFMGEIRPSIFSFIIHLHKYEKKNKKIAPKGSTMSKGTRSKFESFVN